MLKKSGPRLLMSLFILLMTVFLVAPTSAATDIGLTRDTAKLAPIIDTALIAPVSETEKINLAGVKVKGEGGKQIPLRLTPNQLQPISVGQTINGVLSTSDPIDPAFPSTSHFYVDAYTFNGDSGQQVAISMSATLDTWLDLYRVDGAVLTKVASNNNISTSNLNSRIPTSGYFALPSAGQYIIIAGSYYEGATGAYTLTLVGSPNYAVSGKVTQTSSSGAAVAGATMTFAKVSGTGTTVPAAVQTSSTGAWSQSGFEAGTTYKVTPYKAGYTFAPAYINVSSANASANFVASPNPAPSPISVGQTINGILSTTDPLDPNYPGNTFYVDDYIFSGTSGQQIAITMNSSAFDTWLELWKKNADGSLQKLMTNNDISSTNHNSRIPATGYYTLPATGQYVIRASSNLQNATGVYALTLTGSATIPTIVAGAIVNGALATSDSYSEFKGTGYYADKYKFTASAGTQVAFALSSNDFDTFISVKGPNGQLVAYDDSSGDDWDSLVPSTGFYSLPFTGDYVIEVTSFSASKTGNYKLNVSTASNFMVGGTVKDSGASWTYKDGSALQGVRITFTRASGTGILPAPVYTDAYGNWVQTGFESGTHYIATPSKSGYSFAYSSFSFGSLHTGIDFTASTATTFAGSGKVTHGTSTGTPLADVTMNFSVVSGTGSVPPAVVTDAVGNWNQKGFASGTTYRVTPTKLGYSFTPAYNTISSSSTSTNFIAGNPAKAWTLMVYGAADNNLDPYMTSDLNEIAAAGYDSDVNVVVLYDGAAGSGSSYKVLESSGAWVTKATLSEVNTGNPATLTAFIQWVRQNYPAKNYALDLWGHGGGFRDLKQSPLKGISWDDTNGSDYLTMPELRTAITNSGLTQIDLVGTDACLMAQLEVAYEIKDRSSVFVASEQTIPGSGWPYTPIINYLDPGTATAAQFGTAITNNYIAAYTSNTQLSATDQTKIAALTTTVNTLATVLKNNVNSYRTQINNARNASQTYAYADYVDLYDLTLKLDSYCTGMPSLSTATAAVRTALTSAVISNKYTSPLNGSHGLTIWMPASGMSSFSTTMASLYKPLKFATDTQWDEFLELFMNAPSTAYTVSGKATQNSSTGPALAGVTMSFTKTSGAGSVPAAVTTDASGNWSQTGFAPDTNYRVMPSKSGYLFYPNSSPFASSSSSLNFTGGLIPVTPIIIGQSVKGVLTTGDSFSPAQGLGYYADVYSFSASANQQIALGMTSATFDTYLALIGPNGSALTYDDDGGLGANNDARIPAGSGYYTLPTTGTYKIVATSYSSGKTGNYILSLSSANNFGMAGWVTTGGGENSIAQATSKETKNKLASGTAISGVNMTFARVTGTGTVPATVVTDANGGWYQTGFQSGTTYKVTPSKAGNTFNPAYLSFTSPRSVYFGSSSATPAKKWTFMLYGAADNNLDPYMTSDMNEIVAAGYDPDVNVVVLYDGKTGSGSSYKKLESTGWVTKATLSEVNTGNPATLTAFIQWAKQNYPAQQYAIDLWNHGGGFRSLEAQQRGIAWDDTNSGDYLSMPELRTAFANSGLTKIDLVGTDACLMAQLEVAYEIKDQSSVFVASEQTIPGNGWPYTPIINYLDPGTATASQFGTAITNSYIATYTSNSQLSAMDQTRIGSLTTAVNNLANVLKNNVSNYKTQINYARNASQKYEYTDYIDLYDLTLKLDSYCAGMAGLSSATSAVRTALNTAVIANRYTSPLNGSHGLTIWMPARGMSSFSSTMANLYKPLKFAADTQWDEFLQAFMN